MSFKQAQLQPYSLSGAGAVAGATSVVLKSFQSIDGVNLTMTDFGSVGYGTLEPGSGTLEEQISFTGVSQNTNGTATLTGVKSVLFLSPYTETSGLSKTHAGSTTFVISNTSGFYAKFPIKENNETITGSWTFTNTPITPPTISFASQTAAGVVQEATPAQVLSKTQTGDTGADLFVPPNLFASTLLSDYKVDTGSANAYAIAPAPAITAYVTGQIFSFKAVNASSGASTLNVNGLGAKTIKKNVSTDLASGDILAGQIAIVEYDGTNFQLINFPQTAVKFGGTGADGALSISSGTTTIDLGGVAVFTKNYSSIAITGTGALAFSNPNAAGTIVVLKSKGDVTLTSSTTPLIDMKGVGSAGGTGGNPAGGSGSAGTTPTGLFGTSPTGAGGGGTSVPAAGAAGASLNVGIYTTSAYLYRKSLQIVSGVGGGAGAGGNGANSPAGGDGGRGGGALYIECAGALNFTGTIDSSGSAGGTAANSTGTSVGSGGGGGGSAGMVVILYNTLTAASGTVTATGGNGGAAGTAAGTTGSTAGGGGGGSGSISAAGGVGGATTAQAGSAGSGTGAGGGGGAGKSSSGAGGAGGSGGSSMGGLVTLNTEFV